MLYRPVDSSGDMLPVRGPDDMHEGVLAVADAINSRLRLLYGEWWENEELGFMVPQFLFDGLREANGPEMLSGYITAYIEETPGVVSVIDVEAHVNKGVLKYSCRVVTEYGEIKEEVSQDVVLRSLS